MTLMWWFGLKKGKILWQCEMDSIVIGKDMRTWQGFKQLSLNYKLWGSEKDKMNAELAKINQLAIN